MPEKYKTLCLYIPVLHQGYLNFFSRHNHSNSNLLVFSPELVGEFQKRKEIRALNPYVAAKLVRSLGMFDSVEMLTHEYLPVIQLVDNDRTIVLANDELSKGFYQKYLNGCEIEWDTTFLRWDESNVFSQEPVDDVKTSERNVDRSMMTLASESTRDSSDWWRQVGAVAVKDGVVLSVTRNQHLPSEFTPYINGDPRDPIQAGKHSELCSAIHSEQAIVAIAARKVLEGSDIYVTVFPCPVCAKLLALAGIKRCFFKTGHSSLDGRQVFETFGVEMIRVI